MRNFKWRVFLVLLLSTALCGASVSFAAASSNSRRLGTITGYINDSQGRPLAGALVSLLREGVSEVVRETRSADNGSFSVRVAPGRYSLRAIADGFNAATFPATQLNSSSELVYRFNLEPVGRGRTLPERRTDRDDPRYRIRSAQNRRSIFNIDGEEESELNAIIAAADIAANSEGDETARDDSGNATGRTQGVVETYYAASANPFAPGYAGTNFAVSTPVNERINLVFAGQVGLGAGAPQRAEATARIRASSRHSLNLSAGGALLPVADASNALTRGGDPLGQFSLRAIDEWIVRDGIVVVVGLDYSRFIGRGNASVFSPRIGARFDAGARTRITAAYAPGGDMSRIQSSANFEGAAILFKEPMQQPVALVDGRAVMERSRRMEFGIERSLDERSSVEASAFFDTTSGRGVGILSTPIAAFGNENGAALLSIANQQGAARGLRVVYTRRISSALSASAGYSFGRGQELAPGLARRPNGIFRNGFFQTAAAQLQASLGEGTRITTVFRFSPRATVLAIDPFAGRVAVFDPSLSILITQELPTFGLPVRAEAVLDARNIFDSQANADDGEMMIMLGGVRRTVRGGISFRF